MALSDRLVRAFARLLPKEFRERVFEPAWADILLEEREAGGDRRGALRTRCVVVLECLRLGLPQLLWHHGQLTRLGRRGATALAVIAALLLLMRVSYAGGPGVP